MNIEEILAKAKRDDNLYFYRYYKERNKDNILVCQELDFILENIPDYEFSKYKSGYFNEKNIKTYGYNLVEKASNRFKLDVLTYGHTNEEALLKAKKYLNNDRLFIINEEIIVNNQISLDDLLIIESIVNENIDFAELLEQYRGNSVESINVLKKIITNKKYYENAEFIANNFKVSFISDELLKVFTDERFNYFIKIVDKNYLNTSSRASDFVDAYKAFNKNFKKTYCSKEKEIINDYIFTLEEKYFELNDSNIFSYFDLKKSYVLQYKNEKNFKEIVSKLYFNNSLKKTEDLLKDFQEINGKFLFLNQEPEQLVNKIKYETNLYYKIQNANKKIAKENIVNKLGELYYIKNNEIIKLDGQDFFMLIHKILGLNKKDLAQKLYDNPQEWSKNYEENSYISTSAINQNFFGMVDGSGFILGFNNISEEDILDMGVGDIFTYKKNIRNNITNSYSRYTNPDTLIENTKERYNEVAIKRYRDGKAILPDFVLSMDKVTDKDKEVSNLFNIPIYEINSQCYIDKLYNKYKEQLACKKFKKAAETLKMISKNFSSCKYAMDRYFNSDVINSELHTIIKNANNDKHICKEELNSIKEIVKIYESILKLNVYLYGNEYEFDAKEFEKKIK